MKMNNKETNWYVVLFHSTSMAIRGEKITKKENITVKLIPTPRHLSSDCGIALRFDVSDKERIINLFNDVKLNFERVCQL